MLAASAEAVEAENLFFVLGGPTSYMSTYVCITEARERGGVGNPRGLTMNVVPGPREGLVRPDPGSTPGRPAAV